MGVASDENTPVKVSDYIACGVRCGLSVKEALMLPVGLMCDLWTIYKIQHGISPDK